MYSTRKESWLLSDSQMYLKWCYVVSVLSLIHVLSKAPFQRIYISHRCISERVVQSCTVSFHFDASWLQGNALFTKGKITFEDCGGLETEDGGESSDCQIWAAQKVWQHGNHNLIAQFAKQPCHHWIRRTCFEVAFMWRKAWHSPWAQLFSRTAELSSAEALLLRRTFAELLATSCC